jgi:hypothetical protein
VNRIDKKISIPPSLFEDAISWAEKAALIGLENGVALNDDQTKVAKRVGVTHHERIRLLQTDEFPFPRDAGLQKAAVEFGLLGPNTVGLTLGYAVFIRPSAFNSRILAHECRHVFQFEFAGSLQVFLAEYLQQIVEHGYRNAPMEIDAREWETQGGSTSLAAKLED